MVKFKFFNYFLSKAALKEQELLHLKSERAAFLAVILANVNVLHRHATGLSSEKVYMANPKFAEDLLACVCVDAAMHGDNLYRVFDFEYSPFYYRGKMIDGVTDKEIASYLKVEIYPEAKGRVDEEIYAELLNAKSLALEEKLKRMNPLFTRNVFEFDEPLWMPEPCAETAMIDRAWERLLNDDDFVRLFQPYAKYIYDGRSLAQARYADHANCIM